jgi:hypothetical protein
MEKQQKFTAEDINNLTLLSSINYDRQQISKLDSNVKDKVFKECDVIADLTKFLATFGDTSAAARILHREIVP